MSAWSACYEAEEFSDLVSPSNDNATADNKDRARKDHIKESYRDQPDHFFKLKLHTERW